MKFSILALGAAMASISCVNQCAAQLVIEAQPAGVSESRLVSQTSEDFFGTSQLQSSADAPDYFADEASQAELSDPESLGSSQPRIERSVLDKSVPVFSHGGRRQAPLGVLANVPEVGISPVYWPQAGGCPTPNPVASMMTRNWCTTGLWDGYACENARQCQHIQEHLHGAPNRYAIVGVPSCGCAGAAAQIHAPIASASALASVQSTPAQAFVHGLIGEAGAETHLVKERTLPPSDFTLTSVELPADVPTVPHELQRASAQPVVVPAPMESAPSEMPTVAGLPSAPLR